MQCCSTGHRGIPVTRPPADPRVQEIFFMQQQGFTAPPLDGEGGLVFQDSRLHYGSAKTAPGDSREQIGALAAMRIPDLASAPLMRRGERQVPGESPSHAFAFKYRQHLRSRSALADGTSATTMARTEARASPPRACSAESMQLGAAGPNARTLATTPPSTRLPAPQSQTMQASPES